MIQVNLHEAKAKLSACIDAALRGERVIIARRNVPAVELAPIPQHSAQPRKIGLASISRLQLFPLNRRVRQLLTQTSHGWRVEQSGHRKSSFESRVDRGDGAHRGKRIPA